MSIKVFLNKKKKKCYNMLAKDTNIYLKIKNKSWLNLKKKILRNEKKRVTIISIRHKRFFFSPVILKNYFCVKKSFFSEHEKYF